MSKTKLKTEKPRWKHDCEDCFFLGRLEHSCGTTGPCDLYVCTKALPWPTVIARYSSDGPDYASGMLFAKSGEIPELTEALKRAVEMGILTSEGRVPNDLGAVD